MEFGYSWFINYFIALGFISLAFIIPGIGMGIEYLIKTIKNKKQLERK